MIVLCFFARYSMFVRQLCGSTETGTISVAPDSNPQSLASVGSPLPGVRVEVVDPNGARVDRGEESEISIASPFSATSYLDNSTATEKSFQPRIPDSRTIVSVTFYIRRHAPTRSMD